MSQISDAQQVEAISQGVAAKLQTFHDSLTDDERLMLDLAIRRFVAGEEIDTEGYAVAVYEDAYGYKGRPGTGGESKPRQSGAGGNAVGPVLFGAGLLLGAAAGAGHATGEYPS